MLETAQIGIELVARNESRPDPAGDRLQLLVADQCANVLLGAAKLRGYLWDGQRCGPVHGRSIARRRDIPLCRYASWSRRRVRYAISAVLPASSMALS